VRLIRWTTEASNQLEAAIRRIQQDKSQRCPESRAGGYRIEQLTTFPGLGRLGEIEGTRELVSAPYVVVYRSTEEIVEILYIWHGAQDWR
jgi:plasmid stabilization system protein ParE